MKFIVEIACDNAAFDPDPAPEVTRIVQAVADTAKGGYFKYDGDEQVLFDINGNRVGVARFVRD